MKSLRSFKQPWRRFLRKLGTGLGRVPVRAGGLLHVFFFGGGVSYLHIGPRKPHKQPCFLGNRTPVDVKFLSLFYENWTKIPPSSEPVHSLNNYLWDSCGMPGSATGVTLQFRKRLHFIRHINYGGEKCYWTKLRTRFVFPVGL